jgi:membrane protein DedA with SNARE-associated domain
LIALLWMNLDSLEAGDGGAQAWYHRTQEMSLSHQEGWPMPSTHGVLHLIAAYGYLGLLAIAGVAATGIGVPIPLTGLLVTLGALSGAHGGPSFSGLALASILGVTAGHTVDYWLGRLGNQVAVRGLARVQAHPGISGLLQRALRLRAGRTLLVFLSRFLLTSIASPVSILAGATGMRLGLYLGLEVLGSSIYGVGALTLGRVYGPSLLAHGAMVPAFWIAVAGATITPLALIWLAARAFGRSRAGAPAAEPDLPAPAEGKQPMPSVR